MPVLTRRMKWRRPISETDPTSQISPIIQSISCKSTITTLFSTFSNNETTHDSNKNRTNSNNKNRNSNSVNNTNTKFSAASTLRGLGCTAGASQQVSVPAVIRSSADWQKNRKKKNRRNSNINIKSNKTCHGVVVVDDVPFQDVWCGPGIGFSSDAVSEDCVVTRKNVSSRGKLDNGERISSHRERSSYFGRHNLNQSSLSFLDDDDDDNSDVFTTRHGLESFGNDRFYRNSEIMIIQGKRLMGGRVNSRDQFRDWRLDVDNMSYEQLLELGERIGYVKTGLKEDEMRHNIKKIKVLVSNDIAKHQIDKKCTICQEEYELDDELGMLNCEHCYHFQCIKQWLVLKNFCPVCKQEVAVRR